MNLNSTMDWKASSFYNYIAEPTKEFPDFLPQFGKSYGGKLSLDKNSFNLVGRRERWTECIITYTNKNSIVVTIKPYKPLFIIAPLASILSIFLLIYFLGLKSEIGIIIPAIFLNMFPLIFLAAKSEKLKAIEHCLWVMKDYEKKKTTSIKPEKLK